MLYITVYYCYYLMHHFHCFLPLFLYKKIKAKLLSCDTKSLARVVTWSKYKRENKKSYITLLRHNYAWAICHWWGLQDLFHSFGLSDNTHLHWVPLSWRVPPILVRTWTVLPILFGHGLVSSIQVDPLQIPFLLWFYHKPQSSSAYICGYVPGLLPFFHLVLPNLHTFLPWRLPLIFFLSYLQDP